MEHPRILSWFSCGAASAVAAKLASEKYPDDRLEVVYCDTLAYEHPDNRRFLRDVSEWIGREIVLLRSERYADIYDVFNQTGYLVGVAGARCTTELKKNVRKKYQRADDLHIFGFTSDEARRIDDFVDSNPELYLEWVLRDNNITKRDCYRILREAGIEVPIMYRLGYRNNNCIGCVKGQAGYWNKIRRDFPDIFQKMSKQERKMNVAINKTYKMVNGQRTRVRVFLDELSPTAGRYKEEPDIECGVLCVFPTPEPEEGFPIDELLHAA